MKRRIDGRVSASEASRITNVAWAEGVDSLIPRSDEVWFGVMGTDGQPGDPKVASWSVVEKSLGHLLESQGMYPERYRVRSFQSADQLAGLTA